MANRMEDNPYSGNYILRYALMPIPVCVLFYLYPGRKALDLSVGISLGLVLGQLVPPRLRLPELILRIVAGIFIGVLFALYCKIR